MKKTTKIILPILLVSLLLMVACTQKIEQDKKKPGSEIALDGKQDLKKFNSDAEIIEYLQKNTIKEYAPISYQRNFAEALDVPQMDKVAFAGESASEYSTTNIQVEGVDEADFVKNDGKYIYILSQDKLVIVDAYPPESAKIVSKTEIDGRPRDFFIKDDKIVIFSELEEETFVFAPYDFVPRPRYTLVTHVYVFDVSDRENPEKTSDYSLKGTYYQSRMIGDYVYFIVQDSVYYDGSIIDIPLIKESNTVVIKPDVYYFDNQESEYNFNTVASLDIDTENLNAKTFMMGYTNNIYVSMDNLYITYQKNLPYYSYENDNKERFFKVIVPLLPEDVQYDIKTIYDNKEFTESEKWSKISAILEETYNSWDEDQKEEFIDKSESAIEEYDFRREIERSKTVIQKIGIDDGDIVYKARGEVKGYLLNQFSLDEYEGKLRVATTVQSWRRTEGPSSFNNVYILDEDMDVIGSLEELAPDEQIYSTRFIGDRLYMVTFKRMDPLFVIDLSDPYEPQVLGKLKIPGFSDYLHPYDQNHLIGIGKETDEDKWGGVSIGGVKIALFDVSDVENPREIDHIEIGQPGSDSEALVDHKAFMFDKRNNLLVIPIREVKDKRYYNQRFSYYFQRVWQGAYVFEITPEDGIVKKGKISHFEGDERYDWYWRSPYAIRRSLYMDNVLYTISSKMLKMNSLLNVSEEINSIDLPYKEEYYPPYPRPMREIMIE